MGNVTETPSELVAYFRVSTARQGASGLGLEAQRHLVQEEAARRGAIIVAEHIEAESGTNADRAALARAAAEANARGAALIVAYVSRLTRDLRAFLDVKANAIVEPIFCDFPNLPQGPTGDYILKQLALLAEFEGALIRERTKAALKAAKARGVQLGNPTGDTTAARQARAARTVERHAAAMVTIRQVQAAGITSARGIAKALDARGVPTLRKGSTWSHVAVGRLLAASA